jgi:hypothetical protein
VLQYLGCGAVLNPILVMLVYALQEVTESYNNACGDTCILEPPAAVGIIG